MINFKLTHHAEDALVTRKIKANVKIDIEVSL